MKNRVSSIIYSSARGTPRDFLSVQDQDGARPDEQKISHMSWSDVVYSESETDTSMENTKTEMVVFFLNVGSETLKKHFYRSKRLKLNL